MASVDEACRLPNECRPGEKPFYALAAVLLTIDDHVDIRADLHRIVDGNWWHAVDAQQTQDGPQRIEALTDYLAEYRDPVKFQCGRPSYSEGDSLLDNAWATVKGRTRALPPRPRLRAVRG